MVLPVVMLGASGPAPVRAVTAQDFIDRVRTKLQVTSSLYLEAISRRGDTGSRDPADTAHLTLAYRYPDRFLQHVRGQHGRRQVLIVRGDSFAMAYPHLDHVVRRTLTPDRRRQLFRRHVPLAGVFIGLREDVLPRDAITVRETDGQWVVTVKNPGTRYDFRSITARFEARDLSPESFIIRGREGFRIRVTRYVEEERFPLWVERMFETMNPALQETTRND